MGTVSQPRPAPTSPHRHGGDVERTPRRHRHLSHPRTRISPSRQNTPRATKPKNTFASRASFRTPTSWNGSPQANRKDRRCVAAATASWKPWTEREFRRIARRQTVSRRHVTPPLILTRRGRSTRQKAPTALRWSISTENVMRLSSTTTPKTTPARHEKVRSNSGDASLSGIRMPGESPPLTFPMPVSPTDATEQTSDLPPWEERKSGLSDE